MAAETAPKTQDFATRVVGANKDTTTAAGSTSPTTSDPFAAQRSPNNTPFTERSGNASAVDTASSPTSASPPAPAQQSPVRDRRMSKEWDASKVPPSRFQKREGSLYATPGSRDGHVGRNKQHAYAEKLKEKGWA